MIRIFTKTILTLCLIAICATFNVSAENKILRSSVNPVELFLNGSSVQGGWTVNPSTNPDELKTSAHKVTFTSDTDTLNFELEEWQSKDFKILLASTGDTANIRVTRTATNPFENPDPNFVKISPSGLLSREQAEFDIHALIYGLSEIHPDIFSICRQADLLNAVNQAVETLPDSINIMELYRKVAPIVAMIGDGHTNLQFPYNNVFTADLKRMPLFVDVLTNRQLVCISSLDSVIPRGAKVLEINGHTASDIIDSMEPFVSGERPHFKLARINSDFTALYQMLYPADSYTISFSVHDEATPQTITFPAINFNEIKKRCPSTKTSSKSDTYAFEIDNENNFAVMDFRSFSDVERMELFADSMFTVLHKSNIGNLIIDIRNNGGGNSAVGDVLLRYISPCPFLQMDKILVRITSLSQKLIGVTNVTPGLTYKELTPDDYIKPLSIEEGHYQGNVYLLTSNKSFSSAGSFAWTFKECRMGVVIGEETGGMNVCYGDILGYHLPISKMICTVSFKRFWQFHANENDIHGTIPDISVPADEAMETALKIINVRK